MAYNKETDVEAGDGNDPGSPLESPGPLSEKTSNLPPKPANLARLRLHLEGEVDTRWADIVMITCCFISGLMDSVSFNTWGCFVSMQTGNTIFVGLAASHEPVDSPSYSWARSLIAISCFLIGCLFFSNTGRYLHPLRRSALLLSFSVQSLFIFIAAAIVQSGVVADRPAAVIEERIHWLSVLPLGLLSFGMAGQIVASRFLGLNELPTVVLTSVYTDLVSDANLVAPLTHNVKRNRRFFAVVTLLVGSIIGGWMGKTSGMAPVLWMAAGIKAIIAVSWAFWRGKGDP